MWSEFVAIKYCLLKIHYFLQHVMTPLFHSLDIRKSSMSLVLSSQSVWPAPTWVSSLSNNVQQMDASIQNRAQNIWHVWNILKGSMV